MADRRDRTAAAWYRALISLGAVLLFAGTFFPWAKENVFGWYPKEENAWIWLALVLVGTIALALLSLSIGFSKFLKFLFIYWVAGLIAAAFTFLSGSMGLYFLLLPTFYHSFFLIDQKNYLLFFLINISMAAFLMLLYRQAGRGKVERRPFFRKWLFQVLCPVILLLPGLLALLLQDEIGSIWSILLFICYLLLCFLLSVCLYKERSTGFLIGMLVWGCLGFLVFLAYGIAQNLVLSGLRGYCLLFFYPVNGIPWWILSAGYLVMALMSGAGIYQMHRNKIQPVEQQN